MATIGATLKTMADWQKEMDPDGKTATFINLLSQNNAMTEDMLVSEGNLPTGEEATIVTGLPDVYYRMINQGVPNSKATTAQVVENAAILEARSQVDKEIADRSKDVRAYRMSQDKLFLEAMNQKQNYTAIYGTAANPEEYVGFAPRYSSTSAANGQNIILGGGSGADNTSIYLVGWGDNKVAGVFPMNSEVGLEQEDLGVQDAFDASGNRFRAYMSRYVWKLGLVVYDWRYAVRIPNIDVSDLVGLTGTQALSASTSIIKLMSRAIDRLPSMSDVNPAFYVNRTVASHLRIIALEKSSSAVTVEPAINQFGKTIYELRFLGIPVRLLDAIVENEALVA